MALVKLDRIKKLRELPTLIITSDTSRIKTENYGNGSSEVILFGAKALRPGIGLKEAKDFVEEVMAFAIAEHIKTTICYSCRRITQPTDRYCSNCGVRLDRNP